MSTARIVALRGLAGLAAGVVLAACHQPRRIAPAPDATVARPAPPPRATPATPPPRGRQIVIAYSSNLLGEYEPCG